MWARPCRAVGNFTLAKIELAFVSETIFQAFGEVANDATLVGPQQGS